MRREFHCKTSQALKMESTFDANSERECSVCNFDLHLSAAGCHRCSPIKYLCLNHAKHFCSCSSPSKFFLFRHDIDDLSIMVEALEGKLSAIYRWAKLDFGRTLTSYLSKNSSNTSGGQNDNSPSMKELPSLAPEKPSVSKPSFMVNHNVIVLSDEEGEGEDSTPPLAQRAKDTSLKITTSAISDMDSSSVGSHSENVSCHVGLSKDANSKKSQDFSSTRKERQNNKEKQHFVGLDMNSRLTDNSQSVSGNSLCSQNSKDNYHRQNGPCVAKVVRRINCKAELLEFGIVQSGQSWCDSRAIYPKGTMHKTICG